MEVPNIKDIILKEGLMTLKEFEELEQKNLFSTEERNNKILECLRGRTTNFHDLRDIADCDGTERVTQEQRRDFSLAIRLERLHDKSLLRQNLVELLHGEIEESKIAETKYNHINNKRLLRTFIDSVKVVKKRQ
jgi:hypothetical protein